MPVHPMILTLLSATTLLLSLLAGCGGASAPAVKPQSGTAPAGSYELFTWLDPGEASKRCSFALLPTPAGDTEARIAALAPKIRAEATVGLAGIPARIKSLPAGSTVTWSDLLGFMSSLQFGLPKASIVAQARQAAADQGVTLSIAPGFGSDQSGGGLPCAD